MQKILAFGLLAVFGLSLFGCPRIGETRAIILLSGDASGKALAQSILGDKANVDVADIEDFYVTVTEVALDTAGGPFVAFNGAMEVNLLDLTGVSQVITDAALAPGTYTKIRLSIESPRMYLKESPEVEITDIHLTANGRLFVSQTLSIPEGQTSLILLDFGGLKVVEQGNGGFTLTPQLQVDLSVTDAQVTAAGVIASQDTEAATLVLDLGDSAVNIDFASAQIFLTGDTDTPSGTTAALLVGVSIRVDGLLQADGTIVADRITVLP